MVKYKAGLQEAACFVSLVPPIFSSALQDLHGSQSMSSFVAASVLTVASRGDLLPSLLDSEGLPYCLVWDLLFLIWLACKVLLAFQVPDHCCICVTLCFKELTKTNDSRFSRENIIYILDTPVESQHPCIVGSYLNIGLQVLPGERWMKCLLLGSCWESHGLACAITQHSIRHFCSCSEQLSTILL